MLLIQCILSISLHMQARERERKKNRVLNKTTWLRGGQQRLWMKNESTKPIIVWQLSVGLCGNHKNRQMHEQQIKFPYTAYS